MKPYRQQQQLRPKKNRFVIGREAVLLALETGKALEKIYLQTEANGPGIDAIRLAAAKAEVPINKVPAAKLRSLNLENHQGCVALISNVHYQNLQDLISFVVENGETPLLLMLDGITDVRNIGAIARTAFCCGVHGIIIPDKGVGALNEVAMETSAGALMQIPICRVNSLMKAVDELHLNGIKVFASEMKAPTPVGQLPLAEPCAIVMGSEDKGIYPALEKICDQSFSIPMPGEFESLNVSVATGMILYEAVKQRLTP